MPGVPSKSIRARGNAHLYVVMPALGVQALTQAQLDADFLESDRFSEVKNAPFQTSSGELDSTSWDSGDWTDKSADIKSLTIPVSTFLLTDDDRLDKLMEAYAKSKTIRFLHVAGDKPAAAAKNVCWSGAGQLMNYVQADTGLWEVTFSIVGKGEPTYKRGVTALPTVGEGLV